MDLLESQAIMRRLAEVETLCIERGMRLTSLRREVLEHLLKRGEPVKAYDLQEAMRGNRKRIAPTTIYRTLNFLVSQGFVHHINALNAFVACNNEHPGHENHDLLMFVCSSCEKSVEICNPPIQESIAHNLQQAGFFFHGGTIEVKSICESCFSNYACMG